MITVAIVASYPAVRAGLRAMLESADGITVTGETTLAALALDSAPEQADVYVVDLEEGDPAQASIEELLPEAPVVLLAARPDDYAGLAAAQAPRAWLLKQAPAEEIAAAVQAVAHGLLVMDPAVARATRAAAPASRLRAVPTEELAEPLTERELEVLHLLALGLPNKAIALRLGISEHTVKFHVGAILAKMGAAGRTEAVMVAARRGILPL